MIAKNSEQACIRLPNITKKYDKLRSNKWLELLTHFQDSQVRICCWATLLPWFIQFTKKDG